MTFLLNICLLNIVFSVYLGWGISGGGLLGTKTLHEKWGRKKVYEH